MCSETKNKQWTRLQKHCSMKLGACSCFVHSFNFIFQHEHTHTQTVKYKDWRTVLFCCHDRMSNRLFWIQILSKIDTIPYENQRSVERNTKTQSTRSFGVGECRRNSKLQCGVYVFDAFLDSFNSALSYIAYSTCIDMHSCIWMNASCFRDCI